MSRAIKIIHEIPANKAGIQMFAEAVVNGVMNGEADPLDVRARVDAIERIIKAIKDSPEFKDAVLDQADLFPEKSFEQNGIKFTKAEHTRYDYSADPVWAELKEQEGEIAQLRKEREKLLLGLSEPTNIDGQICEPPFKKSSTYVKLTF